MVDAPPMLLALHDADARGVFVVSCAMRKWWYAWRWRVLRIMRSSVINTCLQRPILCLPRPTPRPLRLPRPTPRTLAPSPVIEHVIPAPTVPHIAPDLVIEYVSSALVIKFIELAPAVTLSVPSQQLHLSYTMRTVTTDVNFVPVW